MVAGLLLGVLDGPLEHTRKSAWESYNNKGVVRSPSNSAQVLLRDTVCSELADPLMPEVRLGKTHEDRSLVQARSSSAPCCTADTFCKAQEEYLQETRFEDCDGSMHSNR